MNRLCPCRLFQALFQQKQERPCRVSSDTASALCCAEHCHKSEGQTRNLATTRRAAHRRARQAHQQDAFAEPRSARCMIGKWM